MNRCGHLTQTLIGRSRVSTNYKKGSARFEHLAKRIMSTGGCCGKKPIEGADVNEPGDQPCCLIRLYQWWCSLSPHTRKRYLIITFAGCSILAWIVGTATIMRDVYNQLYVDPDTGEVRQDEELRSNARVEGDEVSHAALASAVTGYVLGPLMLLFGYQVEPLVVVCNAM